MKDQTEMWQLDLRGWEMSMCRRVAMGLLAAGCLLLMRPVGAEELASGAAAIAPVQLDDEWVAYEPGKQALQGKIRLHGSETMLPLMEAWSVGFKQLHPQVEFEIRGEGTLLAVAGFAEEAGAIGAMSSPLGRDLAEELAALGVSNVVQIPVAFDDVAVIVHPSNPVQQLTLEELGKLFSVSANAGKTAAWGEVIPEVVQFKQPVQPVGSTVISGTRRYFARQIFSGQQDYSPAMQSLQHYSAIIDAVNREAGAIGYVSAAWLDDESRVVGISATKEGSAALPGHADGATHAAGEYPLERTLYLAVSQDAKHRPTALDKAFLQFVASREGMAIVQRLRFLPLHGKAYANTQQQVTALKTK